MYKANGYFPVVRCVCGRENILKRATVCECGVTLRVKIGPKNEARPRGLAPDWYNHEVQPHKLIKIVDWVQA